MAQMSTLTRGQTNSILVVTGQVTVTSQNGFLAVTQTLVTFIFTEMVHCLYGSMGMLRLSVLSLHLKVEGAVTRAYSRWTEDLTSLPEYQTALQAEKEKWGEVQKKYTEQQV